ncbi:DNA repair protein|nr:DNA repair protein [Candidatus Pantoea persica]
MRRLKASSNRLSAALSLSACQNGILDEFDGNLLKTLFLIRYVDVLKRTLDNLVTLSIDKIDTDKVDLRRRVEKSLNKLEREMLIIHVEDKYVFLTNKEKEIENEIRNVEVDFSAINKKLASIIFDDVLKNRKYRYSANKQDFDISCFLNGHPLDGAMLNDLVVKFLTPKDPSYMFYNSDAACRPYTSEGDGCILIRLSDEGLTWTDIDLVAQTEKFLRNHAGQRPEHFSTKLLSVLKGLVTEQENEASLDKKMIAVITGVKTAKTEEILFSLITQYVNQQKDDDSDLENTLAMLKRHDLEGVLWDILN